jgi:amino acid permease
VAGITVFIICVVVHYLIQVGNGFQSRPLRAFPEDWYEAFAVMPNIILAFDYQMNFFPIYKGLRDATDRKMNIASVIGLSSCAASYLLVGLIGYSLSGQEVQANFLESIPYAGTNPVLFLLINVCFLLSIACAYALMFFGCRNNCIAILNLVGRSVGKDNYGKVDSDGVISEELYLEATASKSRKERLKRKNLQFYVTTLAIHVAVSTIAVFLNNIEDILNLIGAICENLIAIILPCLFYAMLLRKQRKPRTRTYYFTIAVVAVITPYGLFTIVANYI